MKPLMVNRLRVESVSDTTPDPYGQPGFSALTAFVDAADPETIEALRLAANSGKLVVVRCACLEKEGSVGKRRFQAAEAPWLPITISVNDLRFFKPQTDLIVERRGLPC